MTVHVDDFSPGGMARDVPIVLAAPTSALMYFRAIPEVAAELARRGASQTKDLPPGDVEVPGVPKPVAAGLAVHARDTGRVLMLQRALDPNKDVSGASSGHLEGDAEIPEAAAMRTWSARTGTKVPKGSVSSFDLADKP